MVYQVSGLGYKPEIYAMEKYAKDIGRSWIYNFLNQVPGGKIYSCRMPVNPVGTKEYDGRWKTIYSIFLNNTLVNEVVVTEMANYG